MIQEGNSGMKRLWPFLLLNIIVSAATVLTVLSIWNAVHPCTISAKSLAAAAKATPTATLPPMDETLFKVEKVIGTGDLENEHIHFIYLGSEPLNLQNWQIHMSGENYIFPAFVIFKGGAFDLYSRSGVNTTLSLYMGQNTALWSSDSHVILLDPAGNKRLTYTVP